MGCTGHTTQADRDSAFAELATHYYPDVFRHSLRLTRHLQDAEDLCQETFLRGFARFGDLGSIESARPWLLRIATNAFIGLYRRWRRRAEQTWAPEDVINRTDASVAADLPESPVPVLVHGEVLAAVESLPVAFREAVTLVDMGETSYEEAAAILSCPIGTVMSRLHRGRTILRGRLGRYAAECGWAAAA